MKKVLFILTLLVMLTSCVEEQKRVVQVVDGGRAPAKLAILIPNNLSNDLLGGYVERNLIYQELSNRGKGYDVLDITVTDEILINEGITDGGQLGIFHPLELCQLLQVDGLLYVDVYDMGLKTMPFYHSRYLDVQVRLFNFDKFVWQKPVKVANRVVDIEGGLDTIQDFSKGEYGDALKRAAESVAVQTLVKLGTATLFEHELKPEMLMTVTQIVDAIPVGSLNSGNYISEVNARLKELNEKVEAGEELVTEEERNKTREEQQIELKEEGILLY